MSGLSSWRKWYNISPFIGNFNCYLPVKQTKICNKIRLRQFSILLLKNKENKCSNNILNKCIILYHITFFKCVCINRQSYNIAVVLKVSGVFDDGDWILLIQRDMVLLILYQTNQNNITYYTIQLEMRFFKYMCNKLL